MSVLATCLLLAAAILAVLVWRAVIVVRAERGRPRGSAPGEGVHVIEVEYASGGGGGGQHARFTVPRDPQEYANLFVPRDAGRAGSSPGSRIDRTSRREGRAPQDSEGSPQ